MKNKLAVANDWMPYVLVLAFCAISAFFVRTGDTTMNVYTAFLALMGMLAAIFIQVSRLLRKNERTDCCK